MFSSGASLGWLLGEAQREKSVQRPDLSNIQLRFILALTSSCVVLAACGSGSETPMPMTNAAATPTDQASPVESPRPRDPVPDATTSDGSSSTKSRGRLRGQVRESEIAVLRSNSRIPAELAGFFDLALVVNLAKVGDDAQSLRVLVKKSGSFRETRRFSIIASNQTELSYRLTPGYYRLDPFRLLNEIQVEYSDRRETLRYAMFLDITFGTASGSVPGHIAICGTDLDDLHARPHADDPHIHLATGDARALFELIRSKYRGVAPEFAWDPAEDRTNRRGILLKTARGDVLQKEGYRVLVVVTDSELQAERESQGATSAETDQQ